MTRDGGTGNTDLAQVLQTTVRTAPAVTTISMATSRTSGIVSAITASPREHPFYVEGKGFVPAGGLKVGDHIVTRAGPPLVVTKLVWHRRPEGYPVYNIVVEGDHTYFVGTAGGGVWVHNVDCFNIKSLFGKSEKAVRRAAPRSWRKMPADGNGWKLVDENNVERVRFMRPEDNPAKITWYRQKGGYWRWRDANDNELDENGNVSTDQAKTHIAYSGP